jgi:3-oxoadipate enol-lactonase
MRELGVKRAHICGLSLGGVIAIALYHAAPERCVSLILADTFAVHPDGLAIFDRSRAALETMTLRQMAEGRADALFAQPVDSALRSGVIDTMGRIDPAAYLIGAEAVWLADQRERAEAIRVPTLVLCGAEDKVASPALAAELAGLVPGARRAVIEHAGHLSNLEQADAFNQLVGDFIRGLG